MKRCTRIYLTKLCALTQTKSIIVISYERHGKCTAMRGVFMTVGLEALRESGVKRNSPTVNVTRNGFREVREY